MAKVSIPRVSDSKLLNFFIDDVLLSKGSEKAVLSINVSGTPKSITRTSLDENGVSKDQFVEKIRSGEFDGSVIRNLSIVDQGLHPQCSLSYTRSDISFVDNINTPDQGVNDQALEFFAHIHSGLSKLAPAIELTQADSNVFSAHHQMLTSLESLSSQLLKDQHKFTTEIQKEKASFLDEQSALFKEKLEALDFEFQDKREKLDTEYSKRSEELDKWQQKIEDADNTTARRETTTNMLKKVQEKAERFNFSSSVNARAFGTVILSLVLMAAGFLNSYLAMSELYDINHPVNATQATVSYSDMYHWLLYLRAFLGSVLFISSVVYLIKWFNSWANKIAKQELDNQQFVRDLNRAHLAVEMSLEWNEKKDGPIPERLLSSITEGLFIDNSQPQQDLTHPAEQLASALVRSADKIQLPFAGGNVELSGKKLSKAKPPEKD